MEEHYSYTLYPTLGYIGKGLLVLFLWGFALVPITLETVGVSSMTAKITSYTLSFAVWCLAMLSMTETSDALLMLCVGGGALLVQNIR